jgi:hypothetical protein
VLFLACAPPHTGRAATPGPFDNGFPLPRSAGEQMRQAAPMIEEAARAAGPACRAGRQDACAYARRARDQAVRLRRLYRACDRGGYDACSAYVQLAREAVLDLLRVTGREPQTAPGPGAPRP